MRRGDLCRAAAALLIVAAARAQEQQPQDPYLFDYALGGSVNNGDYRETYGFGGFRFRWPTLGLEVRGQNLLLLFDRDDVRERIEDRGGEPAHPRRGIEAPSPRRQLTPEVLQQRLARLLQAVGKQAEATPPAALQDVPRFLYFEGGVSIRRDGIEVARCERLWISPLDDRIVLEDAELRYVEGPRQLVVRGPRLLKQGPRWTGRDLTVTTCEAGEPHVAVASGELELIEREGQFEIRSRGNVLQIAGNNVLPLPDAHFFSGEQTSLPLRGFSAGYSEKEGGRAHIDLGMPMNELGGSVHEWLTGRPANEFRGDWNLGLGWIELRGESIDGALNYRAKDLYEGRTEAFYMDDGGPNLREITTNIDGSLIDENHRNLVRSDNRLHLGRRTQLDLVAFHAGDAAVYSEFFRSDYRDRELPETSVVLHHDWDNWLLTVGGRFQMDEFSYADNRALAPFFVEELPVAQLQLMSQEVARTPWDTPIVLDASTEIGQRRRAIDDLAPPGLSPDRTLRVDQLVELSAPFHLGSVQLRPFADFRYTWYDADAAGESADRVAAAAGIRAATRLSRTWRWLDDAGNEQALRHVVSPIVTFTDRYRADGEVADYRQYDAVDALTEQTLVRFEVRNLVQSMDPAKPVAASRDLVMLDLAQDLWPDRDRDNAGELLGLFYYDLQVRPQPRWWPLETLALGVNGDHDWEEGLRTIDSEVQFGKVLGLDWRFDYRRDAVVDAAAGIGAHASLLGRWDVEGNITYDFERNDVLEYFVGIRRDDHDWSLLLGVDYDPFDDQVTFRLEFAPRLFQGAPSRSSNWFGHGHQPPGF